MVLPVQEVRTIAEMHGYEEIDHNKTSKLLSFRGLLNTNNSVRINVYYTTGTIGTCLNHPRKGKTQLFRRNITDLEVVSELFQNPRKHTGSGYYRKRTSQEWKSDGDSLSHQPQPSFLVDSASRWQYVGYATGLITDEEEMQTILDICAKWHQLYWNHNTPPDLLNTNYSCGSRCTLMRMVYEIIREEFGYVGIVNRKTKEEVTEDDFPWSKECAIAPYFLREHQKDVQYIKRRLRNLQVVVKIEFCQWLLGRDNCGMAFANEFGKSLRTEFTKAVQNAQVEYGDLMYAKKANMCHHCGVLYNNDPHEDNSQ